MRPSVSRFSPVTTDDFNPVGKLHEAEENIPLIQPNQADAG